MNNKIAKKQNKKPEKQLLKFIKIVILAIVALYATLFIICLILSGGSFSENGPGAVWGIFYAALLFIPYVMLPTSIVVAINVLASKNTPKIKQKSKQQLFKFIKIVILAIVAFYAALFIISLILSGGATIGQHTIYWLFFMAPLSFFLYVIFPISTIIAIITLVSKNVKK